jgi:serine phosphatase RsbU (regulator of sigma subunit)
LILYTDGLVEGRIGEGPERLGSEGLTDIIRTFLQTRRDSGPPERGQRDEQLLGWLVGHVRELNGGDLDDDLAILALGFSSLVDG